MATKSTKATKATKASTTRSSTAKASTAQASATTAVDPEHKPGQTKNKERLGLPGYSNPTAGAFGDDVSLLQLLLKRAGTQTQVDGAYGRQTEQAVAEFRERVNLKGDGVDAPLMDALWHYERPADAIAKEVEVHEHADAEDMGLQLHGND